MKISYANLSMLIALCLMTFSCARPGSVFDKVPYARSDQPGRGLLYYKIVDLGSLGGNFAEATDINNANQVVGYYRHPALGTRAFVWSNGTLRDLGPQTPNRGQTQSSADAINDHGMIVGQLIDPSSNPIQYQAVYWAGAVIHRLGEFGYRSSTATAVNNVGQIVGTAWISDNQCFSFLEQNGQVTDLTKTFNSPNNCPTDINDRELIVGSQRDGSGNSRAVLWSAGQTINLGALGGNMSCAMAINNDGAVCGWARNAARQDQAFVWYLTNRTMYPLQQIQGFACSIAQDINTRGQIVGSVVNGPLNAPVYTRRAVIWENGKVYSLNYLIDKWQENEGWTLLTANAINDSGHIVGMGIYKGQYRAYILKPGAATGPQVNEDDDR